MTNTNSPIEFFSSISDPRVERTQKHSLDAILFISLCAVICGAEGWNEIEDYGNAKIDWLEKFLHLPNGIPSHDTFNRVISMLDPKELNDSFVAWTKSIAELTDGEVVAIDGKCMRGSSDDGSGPTLGFPLMVCLFKIRYFSFSCLHICKCGVETIIFCLPIILICNAFCRFFQSGK